jgi:hypothetical protein
VECESLLQWDKSNGYFYATYRHDLFQLTKETSHRFFEINGKGHFIGRQMSVLSDEPIWNGRFLYVMEGNNEVNIDGDERCYDYLGSEDSFTFGWGFKDQFAGLHAGMPFIQKDGNTQLLSIYRFHDHLPIRFNKSFTWDINWSTEYGWKNGDNGKAWDTALARNGYWVDYAHVFYRYLDHPKGYEHQPLPPPGERNKKLLKNNPDTEN